MSRKTCRNALLATAFLALTLVSLAPVARAADVYWTGSGGNWSDASNWNNGAGPIPGPGDVAHITTPGNVAIWGDPDIVIAGLELGAASGTQTLMLIDPHAGAQTLKQFTVNGALTVNPNGVLTLVGYQIEGTGSLTNSGTIQAEFINEINKDLFTTATSRLIVGAGSGTSSIHELRVANGFTNQGTITLTHTLEQYHDAELKVINGTLVNAAGATIDAHTGPGTSMGRTLTGEIENDGTITVDAPLVIIALSQTDHVNAGTINVNGGDLQVLKYAGPGMSFTNTGTITVAAGRTFRMVQGTMNQNGGSISGAGKLKLEGLSAYWNTPFQAGSLYIGSSNLTLTSDLSTASTELEMFNGAGLFGPVTVTNVPGHTASVKHLCTIGTAFVNQGTLLTTETDINGALSNAAGALLQIESGTVDVANGFTNSGTIELGLPNQNQSATLNVISGVLVNAVGATIKSQVPAGELGTIQSAFDNRGTVTVAGGMWMGRTGATNVNSGTIDVSGADLRINLIAGSLTNTGTLVASAGRTLQIREGNLIQNGGSVSGAGTLWLDYAGTQFNTPVGIASLRLGPFATATLSSNLSTANTSLTLLHSTLSGPVTVTNAPGKTTTCDGQCNINTALVNQGTLIAAGNISGALTTAAGSMLRVAANGALTIANGFTNLGTLEILRNAQLTMPSGTLVNAVGATLKTADIDDEVAYLEARLDNQGTVTVNSKLQLFKPGVSHVNSGQIDVSGATFNSVLRAGSTFTNHGTMTVAAGRTYRSTEGPFTNAATGVLKGPGTYDFSGMFTNQGTISPGASPGILSITGDAVLSGGMLDIELGGLTAGTAYDRLAVSGTATLGGTLRVTLLDGFCASPSDAFQVVSAGTRLGTFGSVQIVGHGNPVMNTQYSGTGVTVTTVSNQLTVNTSTGSGGSISPSGAVSAACGSSPTFNMIPNAGFEVASVTVDGNSVGAVTNYTFASIGDDHTIAATFVDVAPPAVHVVSPNGGEEVYGDHATKIRWTAADNVAVDSVHVEYSLNGAGGPWTTILRTAAPTDSVVWTPPNQCSNDALIRVTSKDPTHNAGSDVSDAVFRVACGVTGVGASRMGLALRVPNPAGRGPIPMRISLPAAGTATVEVIAVTGQKVWSSQIGGSAGTHEVTWNGRNAEPGIYFARLVTPYGSRVARFIMLR